MCIIQRVMFQDPDKNFLARSTSINFGDLQADSGKKEARERRKRGNGAEPVVKLGGDVRIEQKGSSKSRTVVEVKWCKIDHLQERPRFTKQQQSHRYRKQYW